MTPLLLAIDGGSQSTKVTVFDARGGVHTQGSAALRPYALGSDGEVVHPGDDLWDSVAAACRVAMGQLPSPESVVAIGLCGIRFCRAMVGADHTLVEPVLSWMDARVGERVGALDPAVATIAASSGYLTLRLTGQRRDSAAAYEGMWPIDQTTGDWSADDAAFQRTGMPHHLLPDLVPPGAELGVVSASAAQLTGLPIGCPVYATANDKAVEALGAGLSAADGTSVLLSLGTYIAAMTPGLRSAVPAEGASSWVNAASIPGEVLHESEGIRRGMWTPAWVRDLASSAPPGADPVATLRWLEAGAGDVPPGSAGLLTLPDFLAPGDASYRRGAVLGLDGRHRAHHLYRSVLEGIAVRMAGHTEALIEERGIAAPSLTVAGGGAKSALMMQIVADSWGVAATRAGVPDAAGLGAAIAAAVGNGVHSDWSSAIGAMTEGGEVFEPEPASVEAYREVRRRYRTAMEFTDPMFRALASHE
ncbi:MAG: FGGY-family carbohydrate kinase [Ornithinimicrobium sp.]